MDANPYAAPVADSPGPTGFVEQGARARSLATLLVVFCGAVGLSLVASLLYVLALMDGRAPSAEEAPATDEELIQFVTMLIHGIVFVVTAVFYGRFVAQANRNARALGGYPSYTPASMVWWYFVPIANLWKPYSAVRDVWQASIQRVGSEPSWDDLRMWWAGWVFSNVLDNISFKMMGPEDPKSLMTIECIDMLSAAVMIFTAFFLRRWVLALDAAQQRAFAHAPPS